MKLENGKDTGKRRMGDWTYEDAGGWNYQKNQKNIKKSLSEISLEKIFSYTFVGVWYAT